MPWCPYCKLEYREGMKTCADCGARLVPALPTKPPKPPKPPPDTSPSTLVILCTVNTPLEADLIESNLMALRIPCLKRSQAASVHAFGPLAYVDILVPEARLKQAQEILAQLENSDKDKDMNKPS